MNYAKRIKKNNLGVNFWTNGIGFYLDMVSFVFKTNPCNYAQTARTRSWRKSSKGLLQCCTGKAKKEGSGGRVAKFMVSIAYGKGVIGVHQYFGHINGEKYANIVRTHFPQLLKDGQTLKVQISFKITTRLKTVEKLRTRYWK